MITCLVANGEAGTVVADLVASCEAGEPVFPCFPIEGSHSNNRFIGLLSTEESQVACVVRLDLDPDDIVAAMVETYPGLPANYLLDYVIATLTVVDEIWHKYGQDAKVRALVDNGSVRLQHLESQFTFSVLTPDEHKKILVGR